MCLSNPLPPHITGLRQTQFVIYNIEDYILVFTSYPHAGSNSDVAVVRNSDTILSRNVMW